MERRHFLPSWFITAAMLTFMAGVHATLIWLCVAAAALGGLYGIPGGLIGLFAGYRDWRETDGGSRLMHAWGIGFAGTWLGFTVGATLHRALVGVLGFN